MQNKVAKQFSEQVVKKDANKQHFRKDLASSCIRTWVFRVYFAKYLQFFALLHQ